MASIRIVLACGVVLTTAAVAAAQDLAAMKFVRWTEPKEHSFTVEVPQGWAVEGGVNWLSPIDPQGFVRLQSPDGKIKAFMGDPELLTRQVPTQMGRMQAGGASEGQVFRTPSGGPAKLERHLNGQQYAREHVTWRFCQQPTWVSARDLPDSSRAMTMAVAQEARKYNIVATADTGEVTYTCGTQQGAVQATTIDSGAGGPIEIWAIYRVAGFLSADPLRSMEARYVMEHLLATIQADPQWTAALERRSQQLTGAVMSMQNAATQSALAASRQQNETLSRLNHPNTFVPRSSSGSRSAGGGSNGSVNTTLGTAHVCDAIGRCATVSNTGNAFYMDHSGNVRQGTSAGGPPDNTGVWSKLYQ